MKHDGWEVKKLGEICETITKGTTPKTIGYDFTDSGINFIKVESINELGCFITENFTHISNECHKALMRSQLEEYDMLFSIAGALGRTAIVDKSILPANTNQALSIIRLKEKNVRFLYYLQYYLKSDRIKNYIDSIKVGVAQMNLSLGQLKEFPIIIPPLPEQFRIVEELDQLSKIIEKKRQQLSELDNLAQSIFYDMFGDVNSFVPLSEYVDGLLAGKSLAGDEVCVNKVLKTGAVTYDYFDEKQVKSLPLNYEPNIEHKVNRNDLLVSRMNTAELVGACAYVWEIDGSVYLPDRLWKADVKENANPIYIWKALIQPKSKEQIRQYASGTSGSMKNISKNSFLKIQIPFVSLSLQQLFAQKIEAIEKEKELIKQSIKETEELFNSRMDYYFG